MGAYQEWIAALSAQLTYGNIVLLMAMQASLFPIPAILIAAGFLAHQGQLDPTLVWLSGTSGIMLGTTFNYWLARVAGRPLVLRYGRYVFVSESKYLMAEKFFMRRNAVLAVSFGRLLPVFNHAMAIAAGVFKMNFSVFMVASIAGAAMQALFWLSLGYWLGNAAGAMLSAHAPKIAAALLGGLVVLVALFLMKRRGRRRALQAAAPIEGVQ